MSVEYTPEDLAVIRQRQLSCKHGFIRGAADPTPRCAHCGVSKADWEQMEPHGWAAAGYVP